MNNIGIKYQLRLTTIMPVLLVALLFAIFYNYQLSKDSKRQISHLGGAYIHQLVPAAQLAILQNDLQSLQELLNVSVANPDIQAVAVYNATGESLAYRGVKHALNIPFTPPAFTGDYIETKQEKPYTVNFIAPITTPKLNLFSSIPYSPLPKNNAFDADELLGWLSIDMDTKFILIQHYEMYIVTIFITLIGLLLGIVVHYILSKKIYLPIARLRRSMRQILSNEFETQIKISSTGELGIIEQGCLHLQKQYLNAINDLNQHIEMTTADLQQSLELLEEKNIELSLDKKKSEEKSRQKSELIVNMSHEIRTPMNGVIGFTNVLLDSQLNPLQLDYVKTIKSSAQDLLAIINDILDYSKIDAGKLRLDCIPIDIRACIDEVLALIAPMAHKKDIDLIPITAVNVPKTMLGDPLRIKQMISNLVSNAVKFTEQGYVLVRTTIEEESDKNYTLCLSITDTGIGIPLEEQASLFNAFNQADTTITRRYGGSGLGLVICKKLAEHMQGRITLHSEKNKGSTFSIYIKLEKLAAYEIEKHQIHRFANLKAICFDDNPLHLEALCEGLSFWGVQCARINTFHQLENAFCTYSNYDLAFVNVNQGCEQQVANVLKTQTIPCILMSKWLIQNYEALGAQAFLFKPPNIQKLQETIESVIHHLTLTKHNNHELESLRTQLQQIHPNLLIAEDNPVNRMLLDSILGHIAHIETVTNGEEAVAICQRKAFNAILLDLQMPILNGLDAARMIRHESLLNKNAPILLISANNCDLKKESLPKAGIDLCLQKPIDETNLLRQLLHLIAQTKITAIDWSLCVQKVSGNLTLALEFLTRFVEELQKNREEFIRFMQEERIDELERIAHKLHGACCFCGVPTLQTQVAQLENTAKHAKNTEALKAIFDELILSIDAVLAEYEASYREKYAKANSRVC